MKRYVDAIGDLNRREDVVAKLLYKNPRRTSVFTYKFSDFFTSSPNGKKERKYITWHVKLTWNSSATVNNKENMLVYFVCNV